MAKTHTAQRQIWQLITLPLAIAIITGILFLLPGETLLEKLHWFDSGLCAQQETHTFHIDNHYLPFCARDTGMYLGFLLTTVMLQLTGRGRAQRLPPWPVIGLLLTGVLTFAVDGTNSLLLDLRWPHAYQPQNALRLMTGILTGFALAALITPLLNQLIWGEYTDKRSLQNSREWIVWGALLLIIIPGMLATQNIIILYSIAILSNIGVLIIAGSVNIIIILAITKRDQTFFRSQELFPFAGLALLCAVGEMLVLAQVKTIIWQTIGI